LQNFDEGQVGIAHTAVRVAIAVSDDQLVVGSHFAPHKFLYERRLAAAGSPVTSHTMALARKRSG